MFSKFVRVANLVNLDKCSESNEENKLEPTSSLFVFNKIYEFIYYYYFFGGGGERENILN